MTKTNPLFFEKTLTHFQIAADRTLFVDDVKTYTKIAESVGMKTLYADKKIYSNADQLIQKIRDTLLG